MATGEHVQFVKVMDATLDSTNKLIVSAAGAAKVDGSAVTQPVSIAATVNVNPAGETAGVGVGAAADASTVNSVIGLLKKLIGLFPAALGAGGGLKVDGSGTALPVSGTVGVSGAVDTELTTADLDTGAGTDTRAVVGIAGAASGGAVLVQATAAGNLKEDIATIAGTAPTTAGKLDVKGADGDVFVRQATAANLNATIEVLTGTLAGLTVKRAFANTAASTTDGALVTAVASKKLRVLAVAAVAGGTATNLTFNSKPAGAGTAISPLFANAANGGEILPFMQHGWFESNAGEGLTVTTGAGSTTGILVVYVEV